MPKLTFELEKPYKELCKEEFLEQLKVSKHLIGVLYRPDVLSGPYPNRTFKIIDTDFTNVSFSKTELKDVFFLNCKFNSCFLIGTHLNNCEFHDCEFRNVNTHKIKINNTYINPKAFIKNITEFGMSNIAVHLFQQLLDNSRDLQQSKFSRIAQYNFEKWKARNLIKECFLDKKRTISKLDFVKKYPFAWLFKWAFGFGLRLRNFFVTSIVVFISFTIINYKNWPSYNLQSDGELIEGFNAAEPNITSSMYYTFEATTKLINTHLQTTSLIGMGWLLAQSLFGFMLFSALITIILNRFVK